MRSANHYNPNLGMGTEVTPKAKWYPEPKDLEETITREQAIRFYTMNNPWLLFWENQHESLVEGKLADFVVIGRYILNCPAESSIHTGSLGDIGWKTGRQKRLISLYIRAIERPESSAWQQDKVISESIKSLLCKLSN